MIPFIPEAWTSMEILIFGGFLVLAVVAAAVNRLAKNTDQQKQSVSNINFLAFQRKFFLVYFLALFGDWLQGPYVYKLYDYYGFKESQVNLINVLSNVSKMFNFSFFRLLCFM